MAFINTIEELKQYKKRIELQNDVLLLSTVFSEEEKRQIAECYNSLIVITDKKIFELNKASKSTK